MLTQRGCTGGDRSLFPCESLLEPIRIFAHYGAGLLVRRTVAIRPRASWWEFRVSLFCSRRGCEGRRRSRERVLRTIIGKPPGSLSLSS